MSDFTFLHKFKSKCAVRRLKYTAYFSKKGIIQGGASNRGTGRKALVIAVSVTAYNFCYYLI